MMWEYEEDPTTVPAVSEVLKGVTAGATFGHALPVKFDASIESAIKEAIDRVPEGKRNSAFIKLSSGTSEGDGAGVQVGYVRKITADGKAKVAVVANIPFQGGGFSAGVLGQIDWAPEPEPEA